MSESHELQVRYEDIQRAHDRLDDDTVVKHTPVEQSTSLGEAVGGEVYLKMEHLQWTGSFKTRGAYNKISQSVDEGVDEVRSGRDYRHAEDRPAGQDRRDPRLRGDSRTRWSGLPRCHVVHPGRSGRWRRGVRPRVRRSAHRCRARDARDRDVRGLPGSGHCGRPYRWWRTHQRDRHRLRPPLSDTRIVGVQAEGVSTVHESLDKGMPVTLGEVDTIADGIATGGISDLTLDLIDVHVDKIVTVSDTEIAKAILLLLERAKQVVEGAAAAPVAAVLSPDLDVRGETVMPLLGVEPST